MATASTKVGRAKGAYLLVLLNIFFAVLAVIGQVAQNVSLPLWIGATSELEDPNCTDINITAIDASNSSYTPAMDPFFVLSFASLSFVVIFGAISLVIIVIQLILNHLFGKDVKFITMKDDILFPQWQFVLVGVFDALNGVFVVFAADPSRTAPFLQAILGNFIIPLTILFRLILLRKRPTLLKLLCAIAVFIGLILSLIPTIIGVKGDDSSEYFKQSRVGQALWPLCFMFGFVPAAIMNVIEEKSLKDRRKVNLFYFLFCTSTYQLITVWLLFWIDILPGFGFVHNVQEFRENYDFAFKCFFGGADCGFKPGLFGVIFIFMYFVSYVGGGLLIRYAEGATYLAIVQSLVTPLGALFWSIFIRNECAGLSLHPHANNLTYFSIGGMVIMVPAIFLYNIGTFATLKKTFYSCLASLHLVKAHPVEYKQTESSPLLKSPPTINA